MARLKGPWQTRVDFAPGAGFAFRPGEVLVRGGDEEDAQIILWETHKGGDADSKGHELDKAQLRLRLLVERSRAGADFPFEGDLDEAIADAEAAIVRLREEHPANAAFPSEPVLGGLFVRFKDVPETLETVAKLNQAGIYAQPNHVLFAHSSSGAEGLQANPFYANPFYANPFYANPFYANPFYANPFYANPFYANPFYANPFYANSNPAADPAMRQTGRRPSSARPAHPKSVEFIKGTGKPVIAILDTGYSAVGSIPKELRPGNLAETAESFVDIPDIDDQGYLDPVAGHGTFIAGIIEQLVPGCTIEVHKVLESYGDGDEVAVGATLLNLAKRAEMDPDSNQDLIVNMSFGGYSSSGMAALAEAIASLHHTGAAIVASAGNDGTGLPMYPAALPHVVAVGALDHEGAPAPFTNFGPWVRACSLGVEVVSTFFKFNGAHPVQGDTQIDEFDGWAVWSGTSFAAPRVVAALARHMRKPGSSAHDAVRDLVDAAGGDRRPLLGKVIDL